MQKKHNVFVWYVRANEDRYCTNNSCSGIINVVRQPASSILFCTRFPTVMPPFGSHGVTHLRLERRSPYHTGHTGERDYAFGQAMLGLRTAIGLTQTGLAEYLGISRRAVGEWEAGSSYPKAERLKHLIELAVQQQAFAAGREVEEIRALWKAARQKVLLDEHWLSSLLASSRPSLELVAPLPLASIPAQPPVPARAA